MKISKLFHWLYAILMLLPVVAIGSTILVNVFKKEQQTKYLYQTNEVNSIDDIKIGNIYHIDLNYLDTNSNLVLLCDDLFNVDLKSDNIFLNEYYQDLKNNCSINVEYIEEDYDYSFLFYDYVNTNIQYPGGYFEYYSNEVDDLGSFDDSFNFSCDFILKSIQSIDTSYLKYITKCKLENIPTENIKSNSNNVFYYTIEQIEDSSIFNWAMSSFLVTPFSYIVGLFGMPSNNIVVLLLSYWLDISIIWLVFDLVMYVPLLVHRWIDKAGIE